MKKNQITIQQAVTINKPRDVVWDFTQDYSLRTKWDRGVIEAIVLQTSPHRIVKLKTRGNTTMTFVYKLDERPNRTSLAARDILSPLIIAAGGSWLYEENEGATLWTQTNTIVFKKNILTRIFLPIFKRIFTLQTISAMKKAKEELENEPVVCAP